MFERVQFEIAYYYEFWQYYDFFGYFKSQGQKKNSANLSIFYRCVLFFFNFCNLVKSTNLFLLQCTKIYAFCTLSKFMLGNKNLYRCKFMVVKLSKSVKEL